MRDTFYFDADCGFCTWCAEWLRKLAPTVAVEPGRGLYIQKNAYFRDSRGKDYLGHRAISIALRRHGKSPTLRALGAALGLPIFAVVYRLVALNRHRLGPLVGRQSCSIHK